MHAEPVFRRGLMFVSDKASARRAGGSLKETTNKDTKMDTLVVFGTACFIATYAIIIYRHLPQE
jgi:hypothetical protein